MFPKERQVIEIAMTSLLPNNPAKEAAAVLPAGHVARVLEPSPPAVDDGDFFADDPPNAPVGSGTVVAPTSSGDMTWVELVEAHPKLAEFARPRWLGAYAAIAPTPDGYGTTLTSLHRLAMAAIAPARHQANTKFGLRWVPGGFGTPFYGDDTQIRVLGNRLLIERAGVGEEHAVTTIAAAAELVGATVDMTTATEHDSPAIGALDEPLDIDDAHAAFISEWWGLGTAALELVRNDDATVNPGRPQLWPGHFDVGVEFGSEDARASFGASPGDHSHDEPYLYVAPWYADRLTIEPDDFWNAQGFTGAELPASKLGNGDPVVTAVAFYRTARDLLAASIAK